LTIKYRGGARVEIKLSKVVTRKWMTKDDLHPAKKLKLTQSGIGKSAFRQFWELETA
jgi:hypothetical protein